MAFYEDDKKHEEGEGELSPDSLDEMMDEEDDEDEDLLDTPDEDKDEY